MKKLIFTAVLLLTISSLTFSQASTSANVTANVNATLSITRLTDLNIGNVMQGATATILSTAAAAASFQITGAASTATTVTVTFPTELTSGVNTMPFTGQTPRYNTVAGAGTSTAFGSPTGGTTNSNASGNLWIYVGGGVTAASSQPVGSYTGTITVGVTQP